MPAISSDVPIGYRMNGEEMLSCMPETIGRPAHLLLKAIGVALWCPRANVRFLKTLNFVRASGTSAVLRPALWPIRLVPSRWLAYKLSPFAMACEWKAKAAD